MAGVNIIDPNYLKELAAWQKQGAAAAVSAGTSGASIPHNCGITHGVVSSGSNSAMDPFQVARYEAAKEVSATCDWLASKLEAGGKIWDEVTQETAFNFTRQMQDD